jgi:hypothetical protein
MFLGENLIKCAVLNSFCPMFAFLLFILIDMWSTVIIVLVKCI